jgi:hypothetical protein
LSITLRTSGEPPQTVLVIIDGVGSRPLTPDPTRKVFSGPLAVDSDVPKTYRLAIGYQNFRYPLGVRLHKNMPPVEFGIALTSAASCTDAKIQKLEERSVDFEEALSRSLQAKQILAIEGNDRCRPDLRVRAVRAAYRNNVKARDLSNGLIAVNEEFASQYAASLPTVAVLAEVAEYRDRELRSEAVQLVADRNAAQEDRDFATAFEIQKTIADRVKAEPAVTIAYAAEGITADRAEKDSAFLGSIAKGEVQAERPQD